MNFSNTDDKFAMFSVKFKNINTDKKESKTKVTFGFTLKKLKNTAKSRKTT